MTSVKPEARQTVEPKKVDRLNSKDGLIWWVRDNLHDYLFLLHIIVFCLPTLVLCYAVGLTPASIAGSMLSISAEWSQAFFGDGWHFDDCLDTGFNLLGVLIGLTVWHYLMPVLIRRFGVMRHKEVKA